MLFLCQRHGRCNRFPMAVAAVSGELVFVSKCNGCSYYGSLRLSRAVDQCLRVVRHTLSRLFSQCFPHITNLPTSCVRVTFLTQQICHTKSAEDLPNAHAVICYFLKICIDSQLTRRPFQLRLKSLVKFRVVYLFLPLKFSRTATPFLTKFTAAHLLSIPIRRQARGTTPPPPSASHTPTHCRSAKRVPLSVTAHRTKPSRAEPHRIVSAPTRAWGPPRSGRTTTPPLQQVVCCLDDKHANPIHHHEAAIRH